jgi:hypothetical protein
LSTKDVLLEVAEKLPQDASLEAVLSALGLKLRFAAG